MPDRVLCPKCHGQRTVFCPACRGNGKQLIAGVSSGDCSECNGTANVTEPVNAVVMFVAGLAKSNKQLRQSCSAS